MDEKEVIEIGRFNAIDENDKVYVIVSFQEYIVSHTHSGVSRIPSIKHLETINGDHVNFIDENTFEIVARGTTAKRVR